MERYRPPVGGQAHQDVVASDERVQALGISTDEPPREAVEVHVAAVLPVVGGRRRRGARWARVSALALFLLCCALLVTTNVSTRLSAADIATLENDLELRGLPRPITFEDEIRTIRLVQQRVLAKASINQGIPTYEPREPSDLMRYRRGLCYDRSRTIDKALTYLGFETRHVFLLYRKDLSFLRALVRRKHPSHAVTEVKTSRGWLYVDSNMPWIALTHAGEPLGAGGVWKHFDELDGAPEYVRGPWWAIRGLYSRKGAFYAPYVPLPQANWWDMLKWLLLERSLGS
jgi:hypothetical protein